MATLPTKAQDEDAPPTDPILAALEEEKAIAEAKRAIAEAEKATLASRLPTTEGSGIAGDSTFDEDSGYLAQILAYRSLQGAAIKIAGRLNSEDGSNGESEEILLVAESDLGIKAQLWEIATSRVEHATLELKELRERYPSVLGNQAEMEAISTTITAAAAILGAASDIASFFRTNLNVSVAPTTVTTTSLLAETAAALTKTDKWRPIIPSIRLSKTSLLTNIESLLKERRALAGHRSLLAKRIRPDLSDLADHRSKKPALEKAVTDARAKTPPDPDAIDKAERALEEVEREIMRLEVTESAWQHVATEIDAALAATDALVKSLVEGAAGSPSPAESLAAVDLVKSNPNRRLLLLEISSQGGEIHATKSAWKNRLTYLGGVTVTFFLMDRDGVVARSGVVGIPVAHSSRVNKLEEDVKKLEK